MTGQGMLVLSRERDEVLMIGDDVAVTVVDIRGDKVRLGISAPKSIPVHRREVYEAIQRERRAAGGLTLDQILEAEKRRPGSVVFVTRGSDHFHKDGVGPGDLWQEVVRGTNPVSGADAPGGTAPASPSGLTVGG